MLSFFILGNLNAVIFKPTVIYGEGTRHIIEALKKVAEENGGYLPQLEGASSGLLQYVSTLILM